MHLCKQQHKDFHSSLLKIKMASALKGAWRNGRSVLKVIFKIFQNQCSSFHNEPPLEMVCKLMLYRVSSMFWLRATSNVFPTCKWHPYMQYGTAKIMINMEVVACQFLHRTAFQVEINKYICYSRDLVMFRDGNEPAHKWKFTLADSWFVYLHEF